MTKGVLDRIVEGPVLGDGGYLLELEKRGYVQAGPFTPEVVIDHPDALEQLHREFLRAGVDVLQTMTFYASDDKLATVGLDGKVDEINRAAVKIARAVASEGDALVAGNLSLTWAYDPADATSPDHVRALFDRQLQDQLDAGPPDFWIGETFSHVGEALLFVERAKTTGLPVMVTMCFEQDVPRSYEGDSPADRFRLLRHINDAATTFADLLEQLVAVNGVAGFFHQRNRKARSSLEVQTGGRSIKEILGLLKREQQLLHALPQRRVTGAGLLQIGGAL